MVLNKSAQISHKPNFYRVIISSKIALKFGVKEEWMEYGEN